jgi:hypothetical protein
MNWFKKTKHKEVLERCNFNLAAREIAKFLHLSNQMAKAEGGYYCYKKEFIDGWGKFAPNPCCETAKQFLADAPEYESVILDFFSGSCPGGKFYLAGINSSAAEFRVGDYRLDMRLQDITDLKEFTSQEYAVFGRESLQETIYHANATEFLGRTWEIMIGTMEGKIYQIGASLAFSAVGVEKEMSELIRNVYERCEMFLGTPTEEIRGNVIWDTKTGKVIFQYAVIQKTNTFAANFFVGDRGDQRYGNS